MKSNRSLGVPQRSKDSPAESVVASILAEFLERLECGEAVCSESLLRQYPQYADELAPTLRKLAELHQFAVGVAEDKADHFAMSQHALDGTLGDFRIIREIGRGGMGIVYEAEQISLRRRVALKVLPFAAMLDGRRLARFRNEAQAAAQLHHPHIVPIYSVGSDRGVHYYAMQYIEGQSLAEAIEALKEPSSRSHAPHGNDAVAAPRREYEIPCSFPETARLAAATTLRSPPPTITSAP